MKSNTRCPDLAKLRTATGTARSVGADDAGAPVTGGHCLHFEPCTNAPVRTPVRGTPRLLVVFARFAGDFPEMTAPPSWSRQMFDAELPASITHFYDTMSGGLLHVAGEVAPRFYQPPRPPLESVGSDPLVKVAQRPSYAPRPPGS